MSLGIVVLLGVVWAAILAPALFRGRRARSPVATIHSFERSMGILASDRFGAARVPGRQVMIVHDPDRLAGRRSRSSTLRRRRQVLQALIATAVTSALAALLAGGPFVIVFAVALLVLAGYVVLLWQVRVTERRARRVVRRIDAADGPRDRPISARRLADRIA